MRSMRLLLGCVISSGKNLERASNSPVRSEWTGSTAAKEDGEEAVPAAGGSGSKSLEASNWNWNGITVIVSTLKAIMDCRF